MNSSLPFVGARVDATCALRGSMLAPSSWNVVSGHHLPHEVLTLVERAEEYVVLVTAYLDPWSDLESVLRQAVARGVAVHVVTRSSDATHNDKVKRVQAIDRVRKCGVTLHEVDGLHAKMYVNEQGAILTSLNLVAGGLGNPNVGVHLHGRAAAMLLVHQVGQWLPGFAVRGAAPAPVPPPTNVRSVGRIGA